MSGLGFALAVLIFGGRGARGWAEHGAIAMAALILIGVAFHDWRLARRVRADGGWL